MCVIMLNLLISIMGASYEDATSDNFSLMYQFRCQMTCEASVIKQPFMWFIGGGQKSTIFHLQYSIICENEDEGAPQQSMYKQVASIVSSENKKLK